MNSEVLKEIFEIVQREQMAEIGFCRVAEEKLHSQLAGMNYAISLAFRLSDGVVAEITDSPTFTYFHHYRTVNAQLDRVALLISAVIERAGYRAVPIPASQTVHDAGMRHTAIFSHKMAAVGAGLGTIGKNTLYISREQGCRVRLVTVLTDMPLPGLKADAPREGCGDCRLCADACPCGAIKGIEWREGIDRDEMLDAQACAEHMRTSYMQIGRGAVCGICMRVCPKGKRKGDILSTSLK